MPLINYADVEVEVREGNLESGLGLGNLESYLKDYNKRFGDVPVISWFKRKFYEKVDPVVVNLSGDFIGKSLQAELEVKASELYIKLKSGSGLDAKLSAYRAGFVFDDAHELENIARVYADYCFRTDLGPASGVYTKVIDKFEFLAKKFNVDFTFVLGNNDLDYHLFKSRFENLMGVNRVHFIDRKIEKIKGYTLAGFGGSPESSAVLNVINNNEKGLGDYVSNVRFFSEARDELLKAYHGERIDALIVHKAYDSEDLPTKWGGFCANPMNGPEFVSFMNLMNGLFSKLNPRYVLCGHWHEGACFKKGDSWFINPGARDVARTDFYGEPVLEVKPDKKEENFRELMTGLFSKLSIPVSA